jgi:hypothetical protein
VRNLKTRSASALARSFNKTAEPTGIGGEISMLYWVGVYLLVAIAVAVPFLVLYVVGLVLWLSVAAIRSTVRSVKGVLPVRTDFPRANWSVIRRKAA